ncbi:MarR family winged helix-turn-helix transcriptional regulator [Actinomycetospora straminea]|uniref:MarR family transcriptional regulator n=1 Tax=Actinomycetospora straminea TaxID=663607 RepID=A0ABP9EX88_9PSEU|nr:MarR family winged helix-turn-helix transcriptional regulator [Actinomycetospora straminea]MDD7931841.1 MarR family winged helix-turn-helix transcriptional regulator [Actinomycetospora straminea]
MTSGEPPTSPAFLLMALGRRLREQVEEGLRAEGIALRHVAALGHLAARPGLSYSELARRAGVTPQSMQATLTALEQRGAVTRGTDPGRGRTAELHVTEEGARLREVGMRIVADIDARLAERWGDEELRVVTAALLDVLRSP